MDCFVARVARSSQWQIRHCFIWFEPAPVLDPRPEPTHRPIGFPRKPAGGRKPAGAEFDFRLCAKGTLRSRRRRRVCACGAIAARRPAKAEIGVRLPVRAPSFAQRSAGEGCPPKPWRRRALCLRTLPAWLRMARPIFRCQRQHSGFLIRTVRVRIPPAPCFAEHRECEACPAKSRLAGRRRATSAVAAQVATHGTATHSYLPVSHRGRTPEKSSGAERPGTAGNFSRLAVAGGADPGRAPARLEQDLFTDVADKQGNRLQNGFMQERYLPSVPIHGNVV